jgi:hypothetical protein
MKLLAASLLAVSVSSYAATAPRLKGQVNLDGITTNFAKVLGIKGMLPVSVDTEVNGAKVVFSGYLNSVQCIEFGPAEIPNHPETAPCLKTETSWTPEVVIKSDSVKSALTVGNVKIKAKLDNSLRVPTSCIRDLDQVTVIGEVKPMNAPAILTLSNSCTAYVSTRIEDRKVRPSKLRGFSMEAILDLTVNVKYISDKEVIINGDEETVLEINQVKSTIGTMFDFGAYDTKIFKYYDRVLLNEEVKTETSPEA